MNRTLVVTLIVVGTLGAFMQSRRVLAGEKLASDNIELEEILEAQMEIREELDQLAREKKRLQFHLKLVDEIIQLKKNVLTLREEVVQARQEEEAAKDERLRGRLEELRRSIEVKEELRDLDHHIDHISELQGSLDEFWDEPVKSGISQRLNGNAENAKKLRIMLMKSRRDGESLDGLRESMGRDEPLIEELTEYVEATERGDHQAANRLFAQISRRFKERQSPGKELKLPPPAADNPKRTKRDR